MQSRFSWFSLLVAITVGAPSVSAQMKAEELLWDCGGTRTSKSPEKELRFIGCVQYIAGAHDMMRLVDGLANLNILCTPSEGLSNDQVMRVVLKWIEAHPERMNESARSAVFSALGEAFPCRARSRPDTPPPSSPPPRA